MRDRNQMAIGCGLMVAAVLGLVLLFSSGCATSTGKVLLAAHEAGKAISLKVEPIYRAKCQAVARTCTAKPCSALEACQAERRRINTALILLHQSVRALLDVLPTIEGGGK